MEYQSRTYDITPGGKSTGPTPVGPAGFRPPVLRTRSAARQVIDQIHDDAIGEAPSGVHSPAAGDDIADYGVDAAQSAVGSTPPWTEHPGLTDGVTPKVSTRPSA